MARPTVTEPGGPSEIRILLVEDVLGDARMLQEIMSEVVDASIHMERVDRLSAALERLGAGGIDLVLLDLGLPDSAGIETLSKLQKRAPAVPVVVVTGLNDQLMGIKAV